MQQSSCAVQNRNIAAHQPEQVERVKARLSTKENYFITYFNI